MSVPGRCAIKVFPRTLCRFASKSAPLQRSSFTSSCLRRASPPARGTPTRASAPKKISPKLPPRKHIPVEQVRASYNADKMYQAGKTVLFRAPSHFAYLLGSWVLGLGCIAGTTGMFLLGHWKDDKNSPFPWFVPVAYKISMFTLAGLGIWILSRSTRLVTAIDLIELAGQRRLCVSVRRIVPVPFVPPRRIVIAPFDLRMSAKAIQPGQIPDFATMPREDERSKPLRFGTWATKSISYSIWSFFAGTRKILTQEGFLNASVKGRGLFKIDIEGTFPNGVQSLVDMTTLLDD